MRTPNVDVKSLERRRLQNRLAQRKLRSKRATRQEHAQGLPSDPTHQGANLMPQYHKLHRLHGSAGQQDDEDFGGEIAQFPRDDEMYSDGAACGYLEFDENFDIDENMAFSDILSSAEDWDTWPTSPLLPTHDGQAVEPCDLPTQPPSDLQCLTPNSEDMPAYVGIEALEENQAYPSHIYPGHHARDSLAQGIVLGQQDALQTNLSKHSAGHHNETSSKPLKQISTTRKVQTADKSNPVSLSSSRVSGRLLHSKRLAGHRRTSVGMTTLHLAAKGGNMKIARLLLDSGAEIDVADNSGYTALHHAVRNGYLDVATLLLDRGANRNAVNYDGWAVLHLAAQNGNEDIITLLIHKDIDLNVKIKQSL